MLKLAANNHKFLAEQMQLDRQTSKEIMKSMEQANTTALLSPDGRHQVFWRIKENHAARELINDSYSKQSTFKFVI